jgi:hypothetical protein
MDTMKHIEIDFDVWQKLTGELKDGYDTYSNVLRRLLNLTPPKESSLASERVVVHRAWTPTQGVSFPAGTEFRATYKGRTIMGRVENGALVVNGKKYKSPSGAAMSITASPVNGWGFWEYRTPGDDWRPIDSRRSMARSS